MAKWSLENDAVTLHTIGEGVVVSPPELPTVGAVFEKSLGADIGQRFKEAARAKPHANAPANTLQVDTVGMSIPGLQLADPIEDRLSKARKLIKEGKFQEALRVLTEFLEDRPADATATYLKALCQYSLGNTEDALRTLAPVIRSTPLMLDSQVRQLRIDIREKMSEEVVNQVFGLAIENELPAAVRRLEDLISLDPDVAIYHSLRVYTLLISDRLAEAQAAADAASPYCHGADREMLEQLQQNVLRRMLALALEPARQRYRELDYRKARKALEQIQSEWGGHALWKTFYSYLQALGGGLLSKGKKPAEVRPSGDAQTVDQLHFLLVREELGSGKHLLDDDQADRAVAVLLRGHGLAPFFPYLHYLIAQAMYVDLRMKVEREAKLSLEDLESRLKTAAEFAVSGAGDQEIATAPALVQAIQMAQAEVAEIREAHARIERDFSLIRPLTDELIEIIQSSKDGIHSVEHFKELRQRLNTLKTKAPHVMKNLHTDEGREEFNRIAEAVERKLQQFARIEPEIRIAEDITAFHKRLESILGSKNFQTMRTSLEQLRNESNGYLQRNLPEEATKALKDLSQAATNYLGQIAEAELVNPFVEGFDRAISGIRSGARLQHYEASKLREKMLNISIEGAQLQKKLKSAEAKQAVQKVMDMAREITAKIPR